MSRPTQSAPSPRADTAPGQVLPPDDFAAAHHWLVQHATALTCVPTPLVVCTIDGRPVFANAAARELFGVAADTIPPLAELIHPDEVDRALWLHTDFLARRLPRLTAVLRWRRVNGEARMLRVSCERIVVSGDEELLAIAFVDETRIHALEAQRREVSAVWAVATLVTSSGHDLISQLAAIRLHTAECRRDGVDRARQLDLIDAACRSAASLAMPLLTFTRRRAVQTRSLDLVALVAETVHRLGYLVECRHRLRLELLAGPRLVLGDEMLLEQVVLSLVQHAVRAQPDVGEVTVTLRERESTEHEPPPLRQCLQLVVAFTSVAFTSAAHTLAAARATGDATDTDPHVAREAPASRRTEDRRFDDLGLDIVRRVIEGMDGRMTVGTCAAGETRITLDIPLIPPARRADALVVGLIDARPRRRADMRRALTAIGVTVLEGHDEDELRMRARSGRRPVIVLAGVDDPSTEITAIRSRLLGIPVGFYSDTPRDHGSEHVLAFGATTAEREQQLRAYLEAFVATYQHAH